MTDPERDPDFDLERDFLDPERDRVGDTEPFFPDLLDSAEGDRDLKLPLGEAIFCPQSFDSFNSDPSVSTSILLITILL